LLAHVCDITLRSATELLEQGMKKRILIGIAGGSGSGKTYVAGSIVESVGSDEVVIIQEDSYYKDLSALPYDERAATNFDHPDAFDHDLLVEHLSQLLDGESISQPVYDYKVHLRLKETKTVRPSAVIILEGILIFSKTQLRELMDFRVFIETASDICLTRRLERDIAERGRTADSVIGQYDRTVRPMYVRFVEPSKRYADMLISGEEKDTSAVDVLTAKINTLLHDSHQ